MDFIILKRSLDHFPEGLVARLINILSRYHLLDAPAYLFLLIFLGCISNNDIFKFILQLNQIHDYIVFLGNPVRVQKLHQKPRWLVGNS